MFQSFENGGPFMIPTLIFGVLLVAAAATYAIRPEKRFVPLQISLGILTLSSGGVGVVMGLIKSLTATPMDDAARRWLWLIGLGESLNNVTLALGLIVLAALAATVGTLRLAMRRAATA